MALYYNIPAELEQLIQDTKRAASDRNIEEFKEALVVNMYESLKVVIDGNIGRDYSAVATVFERILFDPKTPEKWETQVSTLIDKYRLELTMHLSNFAHKLKCKHCGEFHGTDKWPVNGDGVAFYYQGEPGNFSLKVNCPHCNNDWYVVWDNDPGPVQSLSMVRERNKIHNPEAIKRDIKFTESGEASDACCWNCNNFSIVHDGRHWCVEDMIEVDRRDLCSHWQQR